MINAKSSKVCQIVEGKLSCAVNGNKDLFSDNDSTRVRALEKKLDQARNDQENLRRTNVLAVFRKEVMTFKKMFGEEPTLCLMNYRDVRLICEAFNAETQTLGIERKYLNTYSDGDATRFVDATRVKQGCDQKPGEIKFYSAQ